MVLEAEDPATAAAGVTVRSPTLRKRSFLIVRCFCSFGINHCVFSISKKLGGGAAPGYGGQSYGGQSGEWSCLVNITSQS